MGRALEPIAAGERLLEAVRGRGDQRERRLELADVQVLQWQRGPESDQVAGQRHPAADRVADLLERRAQINLPELAERRFDLYPLLGPVVEREVPDEHDLRPHP